MHRYSHILNIKIKHNQFSFLEIELIVCGTVGSCKLEALIGFPQSLADTHEGPSYNRNASSNQVKIDQTRLD